MGGSPATLPVKRNRPASNPLGTSICAAFLLRHCRLKGKQPVEHCGRVAMHVADDGADLGVAVSGQRLLDEIDKPCLALQGGQKRNCIAAHRRFRRRGLLGLWDRRRGCGGRLRPA